MARFVRLAIVVAMLLALTAFAAPVLAEHQHWLQTPGTCVVDVGSGQTAIDDQEHGCYHRFHLNVHTGTPGTFAFTQDNNPISVGKGDACP